MPSIYTHTYFAKEVYKKLKTNIQKQLIKDLSYYFIFSQSFDNLFYYNFLSLKKGKSIRDFSRYAHQHEVNNYFKNIISYLKLHPNINLKAYLYGSINHYCADSVLHPYIIYKTKEYDRNSQAVHQYKSIHTKYEFMLDKYYYEKSTLKNFSKYLITKDFFRKITFSAKYLDSLNYVFKKTFSKDNIGNALAKSYNQGRNIFRLFITDLFGWKKMMYLIIDLISPQKKYKLSDCTFRMKKIDYNFFNLDHLTWNNPYNPNYKYNYTWDELFEIAVQRSLKIITKCEDYFHNNSSLEDLLSLIGNNSYKTGLPCVKK